MSRKNLAPLLPSSFLALAALSLASCGDKPPPIVAPVAPKPVPVVPGKPAPPPKLTADQNIRMEAAFTAARALAKEADALAASGRALAKEKGPEAANDTLVKAKRKYQEALVLTGNWIEGNTLVTDAQVDAYLGARVDERGAWIKAIASMGKLHE